MKITIFVIIIFQLILSGCFFYRDTDTEDEMVEQFDPAIEEFLNASGFTNLRRREILKLTGEDISVFTFRYGEPRDCIAGCIHSTGEGILNGEKIGLIALNDYEFIEIQNNSFYDFELSDDYLFSDDFYSSLISWHNWVDHSDFMNLLARDKDTPYELLLGYAERISLQRGLGSFANVLLENPTVQDDESILTIIASLPQNYPEYTDAIITAQILLNEL